MIAVEGISMAEQQKPAMRFDAMQGLIRHTGGRGIMLNGVNVEVPAGGFAFVGIELVIVGNMMMPKVRELKGPMAERYGAMRFGEEQLQHVIEQSAMVGGMDVPFVFSFDRPRPKTSVN